MPTNPVPPESGNPYDLTISHKVFNLRSELANPKISKSFAEALKSYILTKVKQERGMSEYDARRLWAEALRSAQDSGKSQNPEEYTYRDLGPLLALGNLCFMEAFCDIRKASLSAGLTANPKPGSMAAKVRNTIDEMGEELQEIRSLIEKNEDLLAPWARENFTALTMDYRRDPWFLDKNPTSKITLFLQQRVSAQKERNAALYALTSLYPALEISLRDNYINRAIPTEQIPDVALYLGFPLRFILNNEQNPEWKPVPVFSCQEDTDIAIDMYLRMTDNARIFAKSMLKRKAAMLNE